ncbi:MAG: hypothetical protein BSR46_13915 [Candidatus Dactylopiibacterium carminicum]|nr:MAG: hypothetical protein BSR46_13915 [Candidatus Dactylopiibacterium carminicum]
MADIVRQRAPELSTRFYKVMLEDPEATIFLNHAIVENRLGQALLRWLNMLFGTSDPSLVSASIAQQRQVGTSHARIKIPINLVCRGARYLKHWLSEYIAADASLDRDTLKSALIYIHALVDLAFETMNSSFVSNADRDARTDEAYRLFSLSQDLAIERERQRAALVEWNHLIMSSAFRRPGSRMPLIGHSEFGLWLVHKAQFMFDRSPEIRQIQSITERIDLQIVPQLDAHLDAEQISALFTQLDSDVSEIKFLLTTLFDRYLEVENGRDALTKLLNRRFLPSALMREIELAKKTNHKFTVMLIDIDHFKRVNDSYGHDTGDTVLQQIAALIMNSVRSGDFVFRYGGEEILVILVDVDSMTALAVAEKMRTRIGQTNILLSGGRSLNVTISIGLAAYDGHPDYRRIITRADTALYEAKNAGRNRSVFAD